MGGLLAGDGGVFESVREHFESIEGREAIKEVFAWGWTRREDNVPADGTLRKILDSDEGRHLGRCFLFPARWSQANQKLPKLQDAELSMLRLMQLCDNTPLNGRGFVDTFLDVVGFEMENRGFDPTCLTGHRRETVSRKVISLYGGCCGPRVVQVTASSESINLVATEDSNPSDPTGPASVPKFVPNRERFVLNCLVFDIRSQMNDLLDHETIFGPADEHAQQGGRKENFRGSVRSSTFFAS